MSLILNILWLLSIFFHFIEKMNSFNDHFEFRKEKLTLSFFMQPFTIYISEIKFKLFQKVDRVQFELQLIDLKSNVFDFQT